MNITLSEFVVMAAGILTILNLVDKILIVKKQIDKPTEERLRTVEAKLIQHEQRFEDYAKVLEAHAGHLDNDNKRIEVLQDGSRIMSKALLVLINHANGQVNSERIQEVESELEKHIFSK